MHTSIDISQQKQTMIFVSLLLSFLQLIIIISTMAFQSVLQHVLFLFFSFSILLANLACQEQLIKHSNSANLERNCHDVKL